MNIQNLLSKAIDKTVTYSRTGGGAGSILIIEFENKAFYTINCTWRIEDNGIVITTSWDDGTPLIGNMNKNAEKLIGRKLLYYELTPQYDLKLHFENNLLVNVFCNIITSISEDEDVYNCNWDFSIPEKNIVANITGNYKIIYTKYQE